MNKSIKAFLWGWFRAPYLFLNKKITREQIIKEAQWAYEISEIDAREFYVYAVGLRDRRHMDIDVELDEETIQQTVDKQTLWKRKWFMREGDIAWWRGDPPNNG